MHHPAGFTGIFLLQDLQRIFFRIAGMDNQWLPGLFGSRDVPAETLPLPVQIAFAAIVIEPGFTNGDDLRVPCFSGD